MSASALVVGDNPLKLWGLDAGQRIARQLAALDIAACDDATTAPDSGTLLIISADYLFEQRTFAALLARAPALLCDSNGVIAAAAVPATDVGTVSAAIRDRTNTDLQLPRLEPADLAEYDDHLRKSGAPLLERLSGDAIPRLEGLLYGNAYKGVTDLVTKWWWPRPARAAVHVCANLGITPNMVTVTGLLLVILATVLFAYEHFAAGLLCGWIMTFLDTVDGKLARVTVTSSRIGHVLDHGMDIVHPPFWYVYWGSALGAPTLYGMELGWWQAAVVGGYVAGRALEALFHALGNCSMFAWRPFDAWFRLVTARRNPCLIILTLAIVANAPALGYCGVVAWTVASSALMVVRLLQATLARLRHGPLESWLKDPASATRYPRSFATFSATRAAYG